MLNTTNPDTTAVSEPKKKRILWLDIAKAIAIFAMIEGHTAPYGGALRNFIYSFHMPLFFIASYYLIGALLARYKKAEVAMPGGCNFGKRPIDLHLKGHQKKPAAVRSRG